MRTISAFVLPMLLLAAALGAAWYFRAHPVALSQLGLAAPCAEPRAYAVGAIDPRFHLTKAQIVAELEKAAAIWNDAAGKPVLEYAPDAPDALPINFVYDARQQSITVGQKIDSTEASQETEREAIRKAQSDYLAAQNAYAAKVEAFNEASQKYAQEVREVNASGGADQKTYARLQAEQASLKDRQAALRQEGDALAAEGRELQARIAAFNSGVRQINQVVTQFNSAIGGEFEEGQYIRDASGSERIDIYAYKTTTELRHTLAHEFGHALGLPHNDNPASIMFPYNKSGATLSDDDRVALRTACKLQ